MVGAAIRAGPGALGGAGGWAGAAAMFVACVIQLVPSEAEVDPRLWGRKPTIPGRISSAITLVFAARTAAAPTADLFFPCLEYRAVSVMCSELGIEKGETIFEGGKAPPEAVSGRVTYTTAAAILYAGLTTGVPGEEWCL